MAHKTDFMSEGLDKSGKEKPDEVQKLDPNPADYIAGGRPSGEALTRGEPVAQLYGDRPQDGNGC